MKAIELFCGIGGFRLACDALGIETVWANDFSPKAGKVYEKNFGKGAFVLGDIKTLIHGIPDHDLLTGGFPCQPFSSAGKKMGIGDPRGTLFEQIVEIIALKRPAYFALENVKRLLQMDNGRHFATILKALSAQGYFVEWRLLNAYDFGLAQNRQRLAIVGTRIDGCLPELPPIKMLDKSELEQIPAPELKKMRSPGVWRKIEDHGKKMSVWGGAVDGKYFDWGISGFAEKSVRIYLKDILEKSPSEYFYMDESTKERIAQSIPVNRYVDGVELLFNQDGGARMGYTVFGINGVTSTLTASQSRHYERYKVGDRFRRLTNIEYARLQGFPDDHCGDMPVSAQYVLYGNAVPPPLVKWAIGKLIAKS